MANKINIKLTYGSAKFIGYSKSETPAFKDIPQMKIRNKESDEAIFIDLTETDIDKLIEGLQETRKTFPNYKPKNLLIKKSNTLLDEGMTTIDKIMHIASMRENNKLKFFLEEMNFEDFQSFIPNLTRDIYEEYENDDLICMLYDNYKFGFIAECRFNIPKEFSFREDGSFKSCSNSCEFYPYYMYADTMEELLDKLIEKDEKMFNKEVEQARKEQGITMQKKKIDE